MSKSKAVNIPIAKGFNKEELQKAILGGEGRVFELTPHDDQCQTGDLMPHQGADLAALFDLIRNFKVTGEVKKGIQAIGLIKNIRYASQLGAGKTRVLLYLISFYLNERNPSQMPLINAALDAPVDNGLIIVKSYPKHVLRPAFIFVSTQVFVQWQSENKLIGGKLTFFLLNTPQQFEEFREQLRSGAINSYSVILVRVHEGNWFEHSTQSIMQAIKEELDEMSYLPDLVIYDDVDTSKVPANATFIPAVHSILVSATLGERDKTAKTAMEIHPDCGSALVGVSASIFTTMKLPSQIVVRSSAAFTTDSTKIPAIEVMEVRVTNSFDNIIGIIGTLSPEKAKKIREMLNGGDFEGAALEAGVKQTSSPRDVMSALLKENLKTAKLAKRKYDFWTVVTQVQVAAAGQQLFNMGLLSTPQSINILQESEREYVKATGEELSKKLKEDIANVNYSQHIITFVHNSLGAAKTEYDAVMSPVLRLRESLQQTEGFCQICRDETCMKIQTTTCCISVICNNCVPKAVRLVQRNLHGGGVANQAECTICKVVTTPYSNAFIPIGEEINLDDLFDDNNLGEDEPVTKGEEELPEGADADKPKKTEPKLYAMLQLVNGEDLIPDRKDCPPSEATGIKSITKIDYTNRALIAGSGIVPRTDPSPPQCIVAATSDAMMARVESELTKNKISFRRLAGTPSDIHEITAAFKRGEFRVVTIASNSTCQGVNLQSADRLIMMHEMISGDVASQILGRIQRPGRTTSAQIYNLLNGNESTNR